jgi:hypothetical protein
LESLAQPRRAVVEVVVGEAKPTEVVYFVIPFLTGWLPVYVGDVALAFHRKVALKLIAQGANPL